MEVWIIQKLIGINTVWWLLRCIFVLYSTVFFVDKPIFSFRQSTPLHNVFNLLLELESQRIQTARILPWTWTSTDSCLSSLWLVLWQHACSGKTRNPSAQIKRFVLLRSWRYFACFYDRHILIFFLYVFFLFKKIQLQTIDSTAQSALPHIRRAHC